MTKIKLFVIVFFFGLASALAQTNRYKKYIVEEGETVRSICLKLSITTYRLLKVNPDIKEGDTLEEGTILIVPNKDFVPTSTSGEHIDYVKDGFLYHQLLPKETFSKLKREYGVSKRQLRHYNESLRFGGLKAGDVIKIPVNSDYELPENVQTITTLPENDNTKPYLVKLKETKWKISQRYGISVEELDELNPIIKVDGLKVNEIILVPNKKEIPDESTEYAKYQVAKSEGLFRISQNFGVTQEELIELNPELLDGVKEGMVIKIPLAAKTVEVFQPMITEGKQLNIVFLLPFMSKTKQVDFSRHRMSDVATDFYLGAAMALDSLKTKGLSVNVKVFDTENSKTRISSIFSALDLSKVDAIIGPMFYSNFELVSKLTKGKNIPIISPVSRRDHSVLGNGGVVQQVPRLNELSDKMLTYLEDNHKGQNMIVIGDDKKKSQVKLDKIVASLNSLDSLRNVPLIKPKKGYISRDLFKKNLVKKDTNWVVLVTQDTIVTRDVINNLGSLPIEYKTVLFALNKGGNFNVHSDINESLANVSFHYPVYSFIDYESQNVKQFVNRYKAKNYAAPTDYSFKGFDITYDALIRFASYDEFYKALNAGKSERMGTKYQYKKENATSGFVNKGVYIVKYDGLNLVKVE